MSSTYQQLKQGFKKDWFKLPNILTQVRLIGSFVPGAMLLFGPKDDNFRIIIVIVFIALAATDMFDGFLARLLNQKTEYGRLLDPIADLFFGLLTLVAISITNPLTWALTALLVVRQFHLLYLFQKADKKGVKIAIVISGKAKTVAVIVATIALLLPSSAIKHEVVAAIVIITYAFVVYSWMDYYGQYSKFD